MARTHAAMILIYAGIVATCVALSVWLLHTWIPGTAVGAMLGAVTLGVWRERRRRTRERDGASAAEARGVGEQVGEGELGRADEHEP